MSLHSTLHPEVNFAFVVCSAALSHWGLWRARDSLSFTLQPQPRKGPSKGRSLRNLCPQGRPECDNTLLLFEQRENFWTGMRWTINSSCFVLFLKKTTVCTWTLNFKSNQRFVSVLDFLVLRIPLFIKLSLLSALEMQCFLLLRGSKLFGRTLGSPEGKSCGFDSI